MAAVQGNVWKMYAYKFFIGFLFFTPVIVLFWQENGLSMTQVMVLQSLFAVMLVLLEIPTGYFADMKGRKTSLLLSAFFLTGGVAVYSIGQGFWTFFIAEFIWATGLVLMSGADSALMYDTLVDMGEEDTYQSVWGHARFLNLVAAALGSLIGGFIGEYSFRWTLYASAVSVAAMIPIAFTFREPERHKPVFEEGYFQDIVAVLKEVMQQVQLRWLILYAAMVYTMYQAGFWLYQPYFKATGLDIVYFGAVFAAMQVVAGLSSKYASEIEDVLGRRTSLLILPVVTAVAYLLLWRFAVVLAFLFTYLHQFVRGFSKTVFSDYINQLAGSDVRATVLSVNSMAGRLLYAAVIPGIGWFTDVYSVEQAMLVLAGTTVVVAAVFIALLWRADVL